MKHLISAASSPMQTDKHNFVRTCKIEYSASCYKLIAPENTLATITILQINYASIIMRITRFSVHNAEIYECTQQN